MRHLLSFAVLAVFGAGAAAQTSANQTPVNQPPTNQNRTNQTPADAFTAQVLHKILFLRDFNGAETVRWHWDGTTLVQDPPPFREFAAIEVEKVKIDVRNNKITLTGKHLAVTGNKSGQPALLDQQQDARIEVDLRDADASSLLPQLVTLLFYRDSNEADSALPKRYVSTIGHMEVGTKMGPQTPSKAAITDKVTFPVPVFTPHPYFSPEASRANFSGRITVGLKVDESGHTSDVWVVNPTGLKLDASAANAVSQYVFKPATRNGLPVAIQMYIEVNFQMR